MIDRSRKNTAERDPGGSHDDVPENLQDGSLEESSQHMLPQDLEAERCVIGAAMIAPETLDRTSDILQVRHFFASSHQVIWSQIVAMRETQQAFDVVALARRLNDAGMLAEVGGAAFLHELMACGSSPHNAEYHAQQVAEVALRREIIQRIQQVAELARDQSLDQDSLLMALEANAVELSEQRGSDDTRMVGLDLASVLDMIDAGQTTGTMTGLTELDQITTGMHGGQMIVVAARPGMGKTALAMTLAYNMTRGEIPTLFFSLEMPRKELIMRLLSIDTGVAVTDMRRGTVPLDQREAMLQAANLLYDLPLLINDRSDINVMQIAAAARLAKRRHGLGCLIVDYLQLVSAVDAKQPREQQISAMSRSMKLLAKSLDIPVIVLAQLNREVEKRKDKRPMLSDLRESGAIEQDADQVWMLHRQEAYEEAGSAEWEGARGLGEVFVRKNRNGETGEAKLQFEATRMLFRNLSLFAIDPAPDDEF